MNHLLRHHLKQKLEVKLRDREVVKIADRLFVLDNIFSSLSRLGSSCLTNWYESVSILWTIRQLVTPDRIDDPSSSVFKNCLVLKKKDCVQEFVLGSKIWPSWFDLNWHAKGWKPSRLHCGYPVAELNRRCSDYELCLRITAEFPMGWLKLWLNESPTESSFLIKSSMHP